MRIGQVLSMAREISGKTLRDLERETGISNALLSQIETGRVRQPGFQNVVKICRALNIKLDTLAEHAVRCRGLHLGDCETRQPNGLPEIDETRHAPEVIQSLQHRAMKVFLT